MFITKTIKFLLESAQSTYLKPFYCRPQTAAEWECRPPVFHCDSNVYMLHAMWTCVSGIWSHESQKHDKQSKENDFGICYYKDLLLSDSVCHCKRKRRKQFSCVHETLFNRVDQESGCFAFF